MYEIYMEKWGDSTTESHFSELSPELRGKHKRPSRFNQVEGPGAPKEIVLWKDSLVVGRSHECDIVINSAKVSKQHMTIECYEGEFTIKDMESRNGIFLNGIRINSAGLRDGDAVQLGDATYVFHKGSG